MGLIDAFKKFHNWGMDVGVTLMLKAPLENAWALMLSECINQGYWIMETDQAARRFSYLVPMEMKLFKGGQKITICVASLGPQACVVTMTADPYEGENNTPQLELTAKGRQRELIGWMVTKLESKFAILGRSASPNTPNTKSANTQTQLPAFPTNTSSGSSRSGESSFDFLK